MPSRHWSKSQVPGTCREVVRLEIVEPSKGNHRCPHEENSSTSCGDAATILPLVEEPNDRDERFLLPHCFRLLEATFLAGADVNAPAGPVPRRVTARQHDPASPFVEDNRNSNT